MTRDPNDRCVRCGHIRMHHYHMLPYDCQYEVVEGMICNCPEFKEITSDSDQSS